jgi:predicted Fe-Mo cluster-binding NifX family protein
MVNNERPIDMYVSNKIDSHFFIEKLMLDEMKIAIPTKDGKNIASSFRNCPYFKILKIKNGHIQKSNYIQSNPLNDTLEDANDSSCLTCTRKCLTDCFYDCQVVIIRRIDRQTWNELGHMGIEVIYTEVKEIDESVHKYLEGALIDKYNT